jgi:hypothetical protein
MARARLRLPPSYRSTSTSDLSDELGLRGLRQDQKSSKIVLQGRPIKSITYRFPILNENSNIDENVAVRASKFNKWEP